MNYTGKKQPEKNDKSNNGIPLTPYIPSDSLVKAVQLALTLHKPLLVTGKPGCGKTKLAYDVYFENKTDNVNIYVYRAHSESTLKDAIYQYDSLKRLHDIELNKISGSKELSNEIELLIQYVGSIENYINTNKKIPKKEIQALLNNIKLLGKNNKDINDKDIIEQEYIDYKAIGKGLEKNEPAIVLIDEIENAPSEFQKDLMRLMDDSEYHIKEIDKTISNENLYIFITCNKEKELSDAFLRRCIFFHIEFPDDNSLMEILKIHFEKKYTKTVFKNATEIFLKYLNKYEWAKSPSISEMIDWFKCLENKYQEEKLNEMLVKEGLILCQEALVKSIKDFEMINQEHEYS